MMKPRIKFTIATTLTGRRQLLHQYRRYKLCCQTRLGFQQNGQGLLEQNLHSLVRVDQTLGEQAGHELVQGRGDVGVMEAHFP